MLSSQPKIKLENHVKFTNETKTLTIAHELPIIITVGSSVIRIVFLLSPIFIGKNILVYLFSASKIVT